MARDKCVASPSCRPVWWCKKRPQPRRPSKYISTVAWSKSARCCWADKWTAQTRSTRPPPEPVRQERAIRVLFFFAGAISFWFRRLLQKVRVGADMRVVAVRATLAFKSGVAFVGLQILFVVAVFAQLDDIFLEQGIFNRLVRVVARR